MTAAGKKTLHVSLVAIPDAMLSTLVSIYDVLNGITLFGSFDETVPDENPFRVEIVAPTQAPIETASGLPVAGQRTIVEIERTDIVIIPSMMVAGGEWVLGRYPELVNWLSAMHNLGALVCSACSGALLLAETGLLDGCEATVHWAYAPTFRRNFPDVRLCAEKALVIAGERQQFVMSGASASWHDLVLYLVARHVGPAAAQAIAKFMLLQWHGDGQAPYAVFVPPMNHVDGVVLDVQHWIVRHFTEAAPVAGMVKRSGLAERSFKRRFKRATGHDPIIYVQHLRVEKAKQLLERTDSPIEEISWNVGYEDPAFFRRLFKRLTGITPGAYRRTFRLPDFVGI